MQNTNRTRRFIGKKRPLNCQTEFIGVGNAYRIIQTFPNAVVLENWLNDQRGIIKINGHIVCRMERITLNKWERTARLINLFAPMLKPFVRVNTKSKAEAIESVLCNK